MKRNIPILAVLLLSLVASVTGQNPAPPDASAPAAQTAMQKWLAVLDAHWQATFKRDVSDPYSAENDRLSGQYIGALEAGFTKASGAGDLNAAIEWRNEKKRFAEANRLPLQDDAADSLPVKQLRAAWRSQLPRMEKDRAARAKALHAKYDQVLAQAQTQLTMGNRLDDALLVKARRDEVAAAWLEGIAAAPPPAVPVGLPKPATAAVAPPKPPGMVPPRPPGGQTAVKMDDRALADKLKEMGCQAFTRQQGDGQFTLVGAVFGKKDWTGEDFAIFDQLSEIRALAFINSSITDAMIDQARTCRKLDSLSLIDLPKVTGKGIQIVTDMPELKLVGIHRVPIGDAAFKSAFGKSNVPAIEISDIGITDASLATMGEMPSLRLVRLASTPGLTAAGWLGLSKARQLHRLELDRIHPGPDGFAQLAKCGSLEYLQLNRFLPTDEELPAIRAMKQLRTIHFNSGKLSDDTIASLKAALPKLIVEVEGKRQ